MGPATGIDEANHRAFVEFMEVAELGQLMSALEEMHESSEAGGFSEIPEGVEEPEKNETKHLTKDSEGGDAIPLINDDKSAPVNQQIMGIAFPEPAFFKDHQESQPENTLRTVQVTGTTCVDDDRDTDDVPIVYAEYAKGGAKQSETMEMAELEN
ncbi:hypothetical protein BC830DRAFT_1170260 [Chytriomyces sp. MP71]|nr:hypothetical protein BC830DRAFT_1170260 [Chytriomyces sp. MP71]